MFLFKQLLKLLQHPMNKNEKVLTLVRIIWWKVNQLFFKIPAVIEIVPGAKLVCYPSSSYGSFVVYAKFPEYEEMQFIADTVIDKDIVFDVGANIGAISVLAAAQGKNVTIHAFEPTPELSILLRENCGINGFEKRITLIDQAVFNKNGTIAFSLRKESEINHIINNDKKLTEKSIEVKTVTLDTYAEKNGIRFVDLLKVDVEGAELRVFEGAKKLLNENKIGIILFEVNNSCYEYGYSPKDIITLLKSYNYFVFRLENNGKLKLVANSITITKTINLVAVNKNKKIIQKVLDYLH